MSRNTERLRAGIAGLWVTLASVVCVAAAAEGETSTGEPAKRALVVGIDDYTATARAVPAEARRPGLFDLNGAVNDARGFAALLVARFRFPADDVVVLLDAAATRQGILDAVRDHLIAPTVPGDEVVFYFAGHGSQAANPGSPERDRRDETLVPADAGAGAPDLRDKELRRLFNAVLDRGARLTVLLDSCHSGSGVRGLPRRSAVSRTLPPDPRAAAATGGDPGPPIETRGALVWSASQEGQRAWERLTADGAYRGAFSDVLLRTLTASPVDEPVGRLEARVSARLLGIEARQQPNLAASAARRQEPLFGARRHGAGGAVVVAAMGVRADGTVELEGGRALALTPGSELIGLDDERLRLRITKVPDLVTSFAVPVDGVAAPEVRAGELFALERWRPPPAAALLVWVPASPWSAEQLKGWAGTLAAELTAAGVLWVSDPVEHPPSHVLAWEEDVWVLWSLDAQQGDGAAARVPLGPAANAAAVLAVLTGPAAAPSEKAALFVHLPLPEASARHVVLGTADTGAVLLTAAPWDAAYHLTGRFVPPAAGTDAGELAYAWVQPGAAGTAQLPARSAWFRHRPRRAEWLADDLQDAALRLAKIRAWLTLPSPDPSRRFPYRLFLRRAGTEELQAGGRLLAGGEYEGVLRMPGAPAVEQRYVYVMLLDSHGEMSLLFPDPAVGNEQNRLPPDPGRPPAEIHLEGRPLVRVTEPLGVDTYFLLTSRELLPHPQVLESRSVRRGERPPSGSTPLERLLFHRGAVRRSGGEEVVPLDWSVEWLSFESTRAAESTTQALEELRQSGDRRGEARALKDLGNLAHEAWDLPRARQLHTESLRLARETGDTDLEARALNNLGLVLQAQGDGEAAAGTTERWTPRAYIVDLLGDAWVRQDGELDEWQASPTKPLKEGARLRLADDAHATLRCQSPAGLLSVAGPRSVRVDAELCAGTERPRLAAGAALETAADSLAYNAGSAGVGAPDRMESIGRVPLMLSPLHTRLREVPENVRWTAVPGARYELEISSASLWDYRRLPPEDVDCRPRGELIVCSAALPESMRSWQDDDVYTLTVRARLSDDGEALVSTQANELRLLPAAERNELDAQRTFLEQISGSADRELALAGLYAEYGLVADAIEGYERSLEERPAPTTALALGHLYRRVGLGVLASDSYRAALEAEASDELERAAQAAASLGLSWLFKARGADAKAAEHLRTAADIYRELGLEGMGGIP